MSIKGKALMRIARVDSQWMPYEVDVFIQTCTDGQYDRECATEDFGCCESDSLPLPTAAYKLKVGDSITVAVVFEFIYHQDYWGEWDVDLYYHKERVLKRHKTSTRGEL